MSCLTVPLEFEVVPPQPSSPVRTTDNAVGAVTLLAEAARLAPGGSEAAHLAVLVDWVADPVDAGVPADLGVAGVNEDDLVVLHSGVLVDPVRVEHTKIGELAADLLLSDGLKVAFKLELVDTLVLRLTEDGALGVLPLPSSAAHGRANNHVALLGLVTEAVGLVGTGGPVDAGDLVVLAVLPSANPHQEAKHVALLLPPDLFHVFVAPHVVSIGF